MDGSSLMHTAVKEGSLECLVEVFVKCPQLLKVENRSKFTPVELAVQVSLGDDRQS